MSGVGIDKVDVDECIYNVIVEDMEVKNVVCLIVVGNLLIIFVII